MTPRWHVLSAAVLSFLINVPAPPQQGAPAAPRAEKSLIAPGDTLESKTLFITASKGLYAIRMSVSGATTAKLGCGAGVPGGIGKPGNWC